MNTDGYVIFFEVCIYVGIGIGVLALVMRIKAKGSFHLPLLQIDTERLCHRLPEVRSGLAQEMKEGPRHTRISGGTSFYGRSPVGGEAAFGS